MLRADRIKPISYVKAHAAEIMDMLREEGGVLVITQNGEARAVIQDIHEYEAEQRRQAMLKIVAMGIKEIEEGDHRPADEVLDELERELDQL